MRQVALVLDALRMAAALAALARGDRRARARRSAGACAASRTTGSARRSRGSRSRSRQLATPAARAATRCVEDAREQTQAAVADVRRLVRGLRRRARGPRPAAALRAHADGSAPLEVELEPPPRSELPAAVELALYRIATEALTNVVRHAHAHHCRVEPAHRRRRGRTPRSPTTDTAWRRTPPGRRAALDARARRRAGGRVELAIARRGGLAVDVRRLPAGATQ